MFRPFSFLAGLALAMTLAAAPAAATQLDLTVTAGTSIKLKHAQHAQLQLPDPAKITPVLGDSSAAQSRGIDLASGSCRLDFTAKATFQHIIVGSKLKRHTLDFSNDFSGTPSVYGQGRLHNNQAKVGAKKVNPGYQAAAFSTGEDVGLTTYAAHAIYRFSGGKKKVRGHRITKPATTETEIEFVHGVPLRESGEQCAPADKAAVQSAFASAIASTQLTN